MMCESMLKVQLQICFSRFVNKKQYPCRTGNEQASEYGHTTEGPGLNNIIQLLQHDKMRIWNFKELFQEYHCQGGEISTRGVMLDKLVQHFGEEFVIFFIF